MFEKKKLFRTNVGVLLLFCVLTFLLYFFRIKSLGLYEDDYFFVGSFVQSSFHDIEQNTITCLRNLPQGRPFAFLFPAIITYIGTTLTDDLTFVYFIGLLFCSFNAYLIYLLLKKWISSTSAFVGALVFLICPADTTKILLTHNLILQPSLFFALLGILFYCKQKNAYVFFAYVFGALTLLFYELGILVFLFAPFFNYKKDQKFIKKLVVHGSLILFTILCISLLRASNGESRVTDVVTGSKLLLLLKILSGPVIGIFGSLYAIAYGTLKGIQKALTLEMIPIALGGFAFVYFSSKFYLNSARNLVAAQVQFVFNSTVQKVIKLLPLSIKRKFNNGEIEISQSKYITIIGFLMIPCAYLLSFTHFPPITLSGRMTSVHLASTVAWGIFLGGLTETVFNSAVRSSLKKIVLSLIGVLFICWSSYAVYLQKGYATVWQGQKAFWKEFQQLTPDMDKNSIILFEKKINEFSRTDVYGRNIINGAEWTLPIAFDLYYRASDDSNKIVCYRSTREIIWQKNGNDIKYFQVGLRDWGKWNDLDSANTIYFAMNEAGDLQRVNEVSVFDYQFPLKYAKSDGVTSIIPDHDIPERVIGDYEIIKENMPVQEFKINTDSTLIEVQFKKNYANTNLDSSIPKGCLRNLMVTGKFGLKK